MISLVGVLDWMNIISQLVVLPQTRQLLQPPR